MSLTVPSAPALARTAPLPPSATRRPIRTTVHGRERIDEYAWLRERDSSDVAAYLHAENDYALAVMQPTDAFADALYREILSHVKQTDLSVPARRGEYLYYARTEEGKQYEIRARKRIEPDAQEEITLDLNLLAQGHSYFGLGAYAVSDDGRYLAYSTDTTGYRQYVLHVKDLSTGSELAERIERVTSIAWAADNRTLFYVTEDAVTKRSDRCFRHELGGVSEQVYEEADERFDIGLQRSADRSYVFLGAFSKATYQWFALRADAPATPPRPILPRRDDHRYGVEHHAGAFFFVTNDGAEDFRVTASPAAAPDPATWREIVPERPGVHVEDLVVFERYAVVVGRSGGFPNFEILDFADGRLVPVEMPEEVHAVTPTGNLEYRTSTFRFAYQSLVTPLSICEIDMATGARSTLKVTEVPGYDATAYASELRWVPARDGTNVPVSLVYRRGTPRDGSAPMLLYGYGSYGVSLDPTFSPSRLALLDRGVVFGIAHVRGGGELGERWRTAGHLQRKLTTFDDFIDCAKFLIGEGYTSSDRLAIQGGSAGGLLMGVVSNLEPQLFAAVVSQVPFVDVMNTMLDASLPLTTSEYLEWGDPRTEADYDYMMRYSPYDNLKAQAYPATLVRVSVNDSQVPYWEGAKLVAKLRTLKTDANPLLLAVNFGAGHGGASGRYDAIKETAFNYAFVLANILNPEDS